MGTTNTAMLEGRITFRTTTDFIAIRNVFKYDDEYKHIRGWLLLINVCVCHNTQNEPKLHICLVQIHVANITIILHEVKQK